MESTSCPLLNEKLWPNFFLHRHHQGQPGHSSTFTHSPNVGGQTKPRDELLPAFTDLPQPSESPVQQPNDPPTIWCISGGGRMTTAIDGFCQVCYILPLNCYTECPCPSSTHTIPITTLRQHLRWKEKKTDGASPLLWREHSTKEKKALPHKKGQGAKRPSHHSIITT